MFSDRVEELQEIHGWNSYSMLHMLSSFLEDENMMDEFEEYLEDYGREEDEDECLL